MPHWKGMITLANNDIFHIHIYIYTGFECANVCSTIISSKSRNLQATCQQCMKKLYRLVVKGIFAFNTMNTSNDISNTSGSSPSHLQSL